ncbi:MAG TPA: hypothetical protein VIP51_05415, partial [Eoetvoesiella sp.]
MSRLVFTARPGRGINLLRYILDRYQFRRQRADYLEYLSALMDGIQGRRTLKEIFEQDGRRYGVSTVRGRLSMRWAQDYQATGGELYATWLGCFPLIELGLIRVAQSFGNAPLISTLRDLADALHLQQQAKDILISTLWSAALALTLLLTMSLAIPLFTVPRLQEAFSAVPHEYYGGLTRSLVEFSIFVRTHWIVAIVALAGGGMLFLWSLPNLTGRTRQYLERYAVWRIYRCVNAMRFLAVLTIVLTRQGSTSTQLRAALSMQRPGASRWQSWHIDAMLGRINVGLVGADTFDTGLLDRDLFWFFSDMAMARGLVPGLVLTRQRLKDRILKTVARQALALRWSLLLICVSGLLGLGLWHYAVIDELRR